MLRVKGLCNGKENGSYYVGSRAQSQGELVSRLVMGKRMEFLRQRYEGRFGGPHKDYMVVS